MARSDLSSSWARSGEEEGPDRWGPPVGGIERRRWGRPGVRAEPAGLGRAGEKEGERREGKEREIWIGPKREKREEEKRR
jgi:hypothetical protein